MSNNHPDSSQVRQWIDALRLEQEAIEAKIAPLVEERDRLEEQRNLLTSLLNSMAGETPTGDSGRRTIRAGESTKEYVETRVIKILEDSDQDRLHINQIHTQFRERGYSIPGAGKPVNITSHIRISERIKSPKRGYYGLVERVGDFPPRTTKKKRGGRN